MKPDVIKARNLFVSVMGQYIETGCTNIIKTAPNICSIHDKCIDDIEGRAWTTIRSNFKSIVRNYPKSSGHPTFPVKGVYGFNAATSYDTHAFSQFWVGEYGNNRRELAIYLLKNVNKIFDIENVK